MKQSVVIGLASVLLAVAMGFSGPVAAQSLGSCGPSNQGQVKSISYYHSNGRLSRYYEFTCYDTQWEMTLFLSCDTRGYCVNLS